MVNLARPRAGSGMWREVSYYGVSQTQAKTHDFNSNTRLNHCLLVKKHLVSIYYMPALCSEMFTNMNKAS